MSQKNETILLVIALFITLGLVGAAGWWLIDKFTTKTDISSSNPPPTNVIPSTSSPSPIPSKIGLSFGETLLIPEAITPEKQSAKQAYFNKNYNQAIQDLEAYLRNKKNDPEALIYLNNAKIGDNKSYAIAVSVPISNDVNAAQEILRGVAQAQNEINTRGGIQGVPLKVLIANDDNDPDLAKQVGQKLVENPDILGVIGHFGSDVTLAAAKEIYQPQGLVMISPTSTTVELSDVGDYIFRTVPSDRFAGEALAKYMIQTMKKQKAVVFYNSKSAYSKSLKDVFTTAVFSGGGEVISEFDLMEPKFNAVEALKQVKAQGTQVIMLAMNTATLNQALWVIQANNGQLPLLGGDSAYKPQILQLGAKNAQGMVIAVPWHILGNPDATFPRTSRQLWGADVNWRTAMAYDAAQALIAGLQVNPTRQGVQETLSRRGFTAEGAANKIRFLPSGDRNQAVQLVKVEPGNRSSYGYDFVPISGESR